MMRRMTIRGEPAFGRGSIAPQPCIRRVQRPEPRCSHAHRQRSSEAADPFFQSASSQGARRDSATSNRHRRSVTSIWTRPIQRAPVTGPDAKQHRLVQRPPARTATRRSGAYAPRPRSWAFEYREHSRCGIETTSSRRCSSDVEGSATPIESCLVGPGHCPSGPALSLGVSFRSRRVNQ